MINNSEERLKHLAWLLDSAIKLPGGFRIGWESIIGLIPGIGDITGAALSSYIVYEAAKLGTPFTVLIKMIFNIILETVIGVVPVVGDIFDLAYKANMRNVILLEQSQKDINSTFKPRSNKHIFLPIIILLALFITLLLWLLFIMINFIFEVIQSL